VETAMDKVLAGLIRRIAKTAKVLNVEDQKSMTDTMAASGML